METEQTNTESISYNELSWLAEFIEEAKSWPTGQMAKNMIIDVDKARRLMETNEDNRNLKRGVIDKINRDLINERYYLNGETIAISKTGKLLNGQHRLTSIIETGIPIRTWLIIGVPDEYKTTYDQGTAKTIADFLRMDRVASSKDVAIIIKLILNFKPGDEVTNKDLAERRRSKQDMLEAYEQFEKPIQYALQTYGKTNWSKTHRAISSVSASHVLISREVPESIVDTFFSNLTGSGGDIRPGDPILWTRSKFSQLLNPRINKFESSSEYKSQIILKTWNAWIRKKRVQQLRMDVIYPTILKLNDVTSNEDVEEE